MAPLQDTSPFSSLTNLFKRTLDGASNLSARDFSNKLISRTNTILPRSTVNPSKGVVSPSNIPNKFVFILLGLIGAGFVLTGIWFFFIAKNGGFYFQENDWDDYKSTVLRRKGPNGTTLSGATESTDLGGGSIVHGEKRWRHKHKGGKSRYTDYETSAGGTSVTGGSDISEMKWKSQKESKKSRSRRGGLRGGGGEEDEEMDIGIPDAVRAYRHEKPARVGGINKLPDGSSWDGSTQDAMTDLLSNREKTPTNTPTKVKKERKDSYTGGSGGGIRKVMPSMSERSTVSFWSRASSSKNKIEHKKHDDEDRIKAEAKKLQEIGRAAQRRDFSFQTGDEHEPDTSTVADEAEERKARREARREKRRQEKAALVPGNYAESSVGGSEVSTLVSDIDQTGTKSYHHVIPGLSSSAVTDYAEDRRNARRGGYRRGGTGSDDE